MEELEELENKAYEKMIPFSKKIGVSMGIIAPIKREVLKKVRDISNELLNTLEVLSLELSDPTVIEATQIPQTLERNNVITTIPAGTRLLRTYPETVPPINGDIIFCNPSPLSNVQIRNRIVNTAVAVLNTTRELRLFNFIPISMLFGAQIKEGASKRGIFSDCCEYPVVKQFCIDNDYDGIVLTDQADYYSFKTNDFLPPELHYGTECRHKMNIIAKQDILYKRAFLAFDNVDGSVIPIGAIYPELIIIHNQKLSPIFPLIIEPLVPGQAPDGPVKVYSMKEAYCLDEFLELSTVPNLIPNMPVDPWLQIHNEELYPSFQIYQRHLKLNTNRELTVHVLPYLYERDFNIPQLDGVMNDLTKLYLTSGGMKKTKRNRKRNKKSSKK